MARKNKYIAKILSTFIYEPISQKKLPEHYYPGFSVPEPWSTVFFGGNH